MTESNKVFAVLILVMGVVVFLQQPDQYHFYTILLLQSKKNACLKLMTPCMPHIGAVKIRSL